MREFELLQHIYRQNRALGARVTILPGDDMGAVKLAGGEVLVTVDQVADAVHFDLSTTPLQKIARKAITRNLSDVAAMAAKPVCAVAAASLPRGFSKARAQKLCDEMRKVAASFDCPLIGGDISIWNNPLLITVTILAEPAGVAPVLRSGSRAGDLICVTGEIGGSLEKVRGHVHHLDFQPRLNIARILAGNSRTRPNAMIDVSDGLARDLAHLCDAAKLCAEIDEKNLPISAAAKQRSRKTGKAAWEHAVGDGEDYELLFTISKKNARFLPARVDGVRITPFGRMVKPPRKTSAGKVSLRLNDGGFRDITQWGWEHHSA